MRPLRPIESRAPTTEAAATLAREAAGQARRRAGLRRRSVVVRVLRVLAPLAMAVLAAVLVGWVVGRSHRRDRAAPSAAPVTIHMSNPRFLGRDSRGRPYVLTGETAVRDGQDPHLVQLTSPRLSLETAPGVAFVVTGRQGLYRDDGHTLTMTGDVAVDDGRGNRFHSEEGEIDTDTGDVVGKTKAYGEGPTGTIAGDAYTLSDHGDHSTFTGRVKSRLYNGAPPASAPAGAPPAEKRP